MNLRTYVIQCSKILTSSQILRGNKAASGKRIGSRYSENLPTRCKTEGKDWAVTTMKFITSSTCEIPKHAEDSSCGHCSIWAHRIIAIITFAPGKKPDRNSSFRSIWRGLWTTAGAQFTRSSVYAREDWTLSLSFCLDFTSCLRMSISTNNRKYCLKI